MCFSFLLTRNFFRKAGQREPLGSLSPISCNVQEMFSLKVFEASPLLDPNSLNCKAPSQPSITNWTCSEGCKVPSVAWHREKAAGTEDIGCQLCVLHSCRVKPPVLVQRSWKSACEHRISWNHGIPQCKFCLHR